MRHFEYNVKLCVYIMSKRTRIFLCPPFANGFWKKVHFGIVECTLHSFEMRNLTTNELEHTFSNFFLIPRAIEIVSYHL